MWFTVYRFGLLLRVGAAQNFDSDSGKNTDFGRPNSDSDSDTGCITKASYDYLIFGYLVSEVDRLTLVAVPVVILVINIL